MKKILMIAYYYPPVAGGGVQRTSKFAKYLPKSGWQPYVLTVRNSYDYYSDESLKKDIVEEIQVFRTLSIEPMKLVRKLVKKIADYRTIKSGNVVIRQGKVKKRPWLLKIKESIFVPDAEIGWLPFAVLRGWQLIEKEKIDVIYSTSCPYTDHLIAYFLKKITRKPWIADFRDPWSLHIKAPQFTWRKFTDKKLEKLVLMNTDKTIVATKPIENDFRNIYPAANYRTITNGYDEDDFQNLNHKKYRVEKFNITYTGILFKENSPNDFLLAVSELVRENPQMKQELLVRIIGQLDNPGEMSNYNFLKSLKLGNIVKLIPYVPHTASIQYALSADVLLLIVNDGLNRDGIMTGKAFEYLRCEKPILAIVPPRGIAAEVIQETNSGIVVNPQSIDEIKQAILFLYQNYKNNTLNKLFPRKGIIKYSRRNLTRMLVKECDALLESNGARLGIDP